MAVLQLGSLSSTTKKVANNQGNVLLAIFGFMRFCVGEIDGKTVVSGTLD